MIHDYFNPVRSVYGEGALLSLPTLLGRRRAVLVTFPEAAALGLVDQIRTLLGDRLAGVIDDVRPNPDVAELREQYERFWRETGNSGNSGNSDGSGADVIVALGGGSAIDTAKALMVGTASGRFDELLGLLQRGEPFRDAGLQRGGEQHEDEGVGERGARDQPAGSGQGRPGRPPYAVCVDRHFGIPPRRSCHSPVRSTSRPMKSHRFGGKRRAESTARIAPCIGARPS